tara:strand:+ start:3427 stop:3732 length:306 start_codon:yes stop_codon:yes gene_type:complete
MSKKNIIKDLKRMRLVPTNKQWDQMKVFFMLIMFVALTALAMYGAWKYPIPHHYYENMNYPANHYSNVAFVDDIICECGNDPTCKLLKQLLNEQEKYRYYV